MGKNLQPKDLEQPNHLAEVEAPVRAELLKELDGKDRKEAMENLVESAMTMGLVDVFHIRRWLGIKNLNIKSVTAIRDRVKKRWLEETSNIFEYANTQRATQIQKAWDEVRTCEGMYNDAISVKEKVAIKKLQLDWMQFISKLSFVDKMVETEQPDMQIIVNNGLNQAEVYDAD